MHESAPEWEKPASKMPLSGSEPAAKVPSEFVCCARWGGAQSPPGAACHRSFNVLVFSEPAAPPGSIGVVLLQVATVLHWAAGGSERFLFHMESTDNTSQWGHGEQSGPGNRATSRTCVEPPEPAGWRVKPRLPGCLSFPCCCCCGCCSIAQRVADSPQSCSLFVLHVLQPAGRARFSQKQVCGPETAAL